MRHQLSNKERWAHINTYHGKGWVRVGNNRESEMIQVLQYGACQFDSESSFE